MFNILVTNSDLLFSSSFSDTCFKTPIYFHVENYQTYSSFSPKIAEQSETVEIKLLNWSTLDLLANFGFYWNMQVRTGIHSVPTWLAIALYQGTKFYKIFKTILEFCRIF